MSTLKNQIIQQKILNLLTKKSHLQQFTLSKLDGQIVSLDCNQTNGVDSMNESLSIDNKRDRRFLVPEGSQSDTCNSSSCEFGGIDGSDTYVTDTTKPTNESTDAKHFSISKPFNSRPIINRWIDDSQSDTTKPFDSRDPLYPFLLIFHVNTVKVKQLIYLRKLLHSKNIKSPCIKMPIRYLEWIGWFGDSSYEVLHRRSRSGDTESTQSIYPSKPFLDRSTSSIPLIDGSSYIFFCSKIIDVQQILQIINESKNLVTSFIHIGLVIQKLPSIESRSTDAKHSIHDLSNDITRCEAFNREFGLDWRRSLQTKPGCRSKLSIESIELPFAKQSKLSIYPFGTYNFLSIYDTLSFIELKSNVFEKIINFLENNKLLSIKISNITNIIVQLLLMNRIICIQMIQNSIDLESTKLING